jgi:uncharacterized protein
MSMSLAVLFIAAAWAGVQNALAGGGTFLTLPCLMLTGMDARAANITSTVGLFPAQVITGMTVSRNASGAASLSLRALVVISLVGGAAGAVLLLVTPSGFFAAMVPWLVLFATAIFAFGSYMPKQMPRLGSFGAGVAQFLIAIYGGYFGGGIGFLMLAALTAAGLSMRHAGSTKNVLAGVMNAAAVAVFMFTPGIPWMRVLVLCVGAVVGGYFGAMLLKRVDEKLMRGFVVALGLCLTVGLFLHPQ